MTRDKADIQRRFVGQFPFCQQKRVCREAEECGSEGEFSEKNFMVNQIQTNNCNISAKR